MQAAPFLAARRSLPVMASAALVLFTTGTPTLGAAPPDALVDYVQRPDDSFAWRKLEQREVEGCTAASLECTSQTWRSNVWRHQVLVVRPPEVRNPDMALLEIGGDGAVDHSFGPLRDIAIQAGVIAACINRVPNQPLYGNRKEDALIAYTFDQYLKTGDATWPLLFPMVKSAVRGMDSVQAFAADEFGQKIRCFVVTGASKRGWTTWLTGAVDPRVQAIAPRVIDMLNMKAQKQWAQQMYGHQSERIGDYTEAGPDGAHG